MPGGPFSGPTSFQGFPADPPALSGGPEPPLSSRSALDRRPSAAARRRHGRFGARDRYWDQPPPSAPFPAVLLAPAALRARACWNNMRHLDALPPNCDTVDASLANAARRYGHPSSPDVSSRAVAERRFDLVQRTQIRNLLAEPAPLQRVHSGRIDQDVAVSVARLPEHEPLPPSSAPKPILARFQPLSWFAAVNTRPALDALAPLDRANHPSCETRRDGLSAFVAAPTLHT